MKRGAPELVAARANLTASVRPALRDAADDLAFGAARCTVCQVSRQSFHRTIDGFTVSRLRAHAVRPYCQSMRIIAGQYKGRRLRAPGTDATRPVTDRVKESIFSSLASRVVGARVADLYAGAGSFGLEALSRGADWAVFVENGRKAIEALTANLDALGLDLAPIRRRVEDFVNETDETFDLVFCDPPWPLDGDSVSNVLADLHSHIATGGLVILTRRASDPVPHPEGFQIDDDRTMGDTRIIRYAKMDAT